MIIKAYKYRIYPTEKQKEFLELCFAVNYKVWNNALSFYNEYYKKNKKSPSLAEISRNATKFINDPENEWMKGGIKRSADVMLFHNFKQAWRRFFDNIKNGKRKRSQDRYISRCKNSGRQINWDKYHSFYKPKHKSVFDAKSFAIDKDCYQLDIENKRFFLPKMRKSGIKIKILGDDIIHNLPFKSKKLTISKTKSGKYYLAISMETEEELPEVEEFDLSKAVGLDLGVNNVAVTCRGKKYARINELKKKQKRLKRLQRQQSRKRRMNADIDEKGYIVKGTGITENWKKTKQRIENTWEKIANTRSHIINNLTYGLVSDPSVSTICLEDLNIKGMTGRANAKRSENGKGFAQNRRKAKGARNRNILEANFGEIKRQSLYKAEWHGKQVLFCDRYDPTSKCCHNCGHKNTELKLKDRNWTCPSCNTKHDRDQNAAINIKYFAVYRRYGLIKGLPEWLTAYKRK